MTDVWKSNARKFCEICKVWFADNRVSIEHHESGQKHKAAVQAKIRELGKQNKEKERANAALEATLAMMESAARSSMKSQTATSAIPPCSSVGPIPKPKQYLDPRAHKASIAEMAKEISRRKKEYVDKNQGKKATDTADLINGTTKTDHEDSVWVEAVTVEGVPYYFHTYTGETTWQAPTSFLTLEQYLIKYSTLSGCSSYSYHSVSDSKEPSEVPLMQSKLPNDGEETVVITQEMSKEDGIAVAANFRLENTQIPLPPTEMNNEPIATVLSSSDIKCENSEEDEKETENLQVAQQSLIEEDRKTGIVGDDVSSEIKKTVKTEQDDWGNPILSHPLLNWRRKSDHPYGAWKRVEPSSKAPEIDYELPTEAEGRKKKREAEAKQDMIVFAEKTAPIVRKKKKVDGPIEFKKRKTNLSIRKQGSVV